ncbi:MAG: hypothetical protein JNK60_07445, partial [Acidobacteria bacterium]|nr:hypothetical protein [Acidobacteriota bacterium]
LQYPDPSDPYLGHLRNPTALLEAANGDILIADSDNNAIRRYSSDFVLKTLAGVENPVGATDGPLAQAKFRSPQHAIEAPSGVIYVADTYACTIRAISQGVVSTYAGAAGECAEVDGPRQQSRLFHPSCLALEPNGNLIVASWRGWVKRITADGVVTTFPLSPLLPITGLAVNSIGEIFVAAGGKVFRIALDGTRTIFSPGSYGRVQGMSFDGEGNLIVAGDSGLYRIDPAGVGTPFHTSLWRGLGVVTEPGGYLLVSDYSRDALIRFDRNARASLLNGRISSTGIVSPFGSLEGLSRLSDGRILATDFNGGAVRIAVPALPDRATIDQPMGPKEEPRTLRARPLTGSHHTWELLKRPRGSRAQPVTTTLGAATFTPDVEGFYTFRLTSTSGAGAASVSEVSFRTSAGFGSSFYTVEPCRVADSRGSYVIGSARPDWSTFVLLPGSCGIPPSARAVALNVTVPSPWTQGSLSVYPDIGSASPASTVSFGLSGPRAAQTIVGLSPEGQIRIDVDKGQLPGSFVHFIIDVAGYFDDSLPARPAHNVD